MDSSNSLKVDVYFIHDGETNTLVNRVNDALKNRLITTAIVPPEISSTSLEIKQTAMVNTHVGLVFLSQSLKSKSLLDPTSNCASELFIASSVLKERLIIITQENSVDDRPWSGALGFALNERILINFSNDNDFDAKLDDLCAAIKNMVQPLKQSSQISTNNKNSFEDVINLFEKTKLPSANIQTIEQALDSVSLFIDKDHKRQHAIMSSKLINRIIINILSENKTSEYICKKTLFSILQCFKNCDTNGNILRDSLHYLLELNACEIIVAVINFHSESLHILETAFYTIGILCQWSEMIPPFVQSNICELLVRALSSHKKSPVLVEKICVTISNISFDKQAKTRLYTSGICEAIIISALDNYATNTIIAESANITFLNLLASNNNELSIEILNKISIISNEPMLSLKGKEISKKILSTATALRSTMVYIEEFFTKPSDPSLAEKVLLSIATSTSTSTVEDEERYRIFYLIRIPIKILKIMSHHSNSSILCESALKAMNSICDSICRQVSISIHSTAFSDLINQLIDSNICEIILNIIKLHSSIGNIVEYAYRVLYHISANINSMHILSNGGIYSITIDCIKTHLHHILIIESCCNIIKAMTVSHNETVAELIDNGSCEAVIEAMRMHISSPILCEAGCWTFGNLASFSTAMQDKVFKLGVINVILSSLSAHMTNANMAKAGFWALQNLISNSTNQTIFDDVMAIRIIVSTLMGHITNPIVASSGCWTIRKFCMSSNQGGKLGEAGACAAVVSALIANISVVEVAEAGCLAIWSLAIINKVKLGEAGACSAIVAALRAHIKIAKVAEAACWAIRYLASTHVNIPRLIEAGACEAVVKSLTVHKEIFTAVDAACWALVYLTSNVSNNKKFIESNICEVLISALKTHINTSPSVAESGCSAICNLSHSDKIMGRKLIIADACDVVVQVLQLYNHDVSLTKLACCALRDLATATAPTTTTTTIDDNPHNKGLIASGACELLVVSLSSYITVSAVVEPIFSTIRNLSISDKSSLKKFAEVGICQGIMNAFVVHEKEDVIVDIGCCVLAALCENINNATILCENGACEAVLTALETHASVLRVIESGCAAIRQFAKYDFYLIRLSKAGIIGIITACLVRNVSTISIAEAGCWAVKVFADQGKDSSSSSSSSSSIKELVDAHSGEAVVYALRAHVNVPVVVEAASEAIRSLSIGNAEHAALLAEAGVSKALLSALTVHNDIPTVVQSICGSFSALSQHIDKNDRISLCTSVKSALDMHVKNSDVVEAACTVLMTFITDFKQCFKMESYDTFATISNDCNISLNARQLAKNIFHRLATVDDVIKLLQNAANSTSDITSAQKALAFIPIVIGDDRLRHNALGTTPGIATNVNYLMKRHMNTDSFCLIGLHAIQVLCRYGEDINTISRENINYLGDCGACEIIINALKQHIKNEQIIELGCVTIIDLINGNKDNKKRIIIAGGDVIMREILELYNRTSKAYEFATKVLRTALTVPVIGMVLQQVANDVSLMRLAAAERILGSFFFVVDGDKERHKMLCDTEDVMIHIAQIFKDNFSSEGVCLNGLKAITQLCRFSDNEENFSEVDSQSQNIAHKLADTGICETVVAALNAHTSNVDIAEAACWAICSLAISPIPSELLGQYGVCGALIAGMVIHKKNAAFNEAACWAIINLSNTDSNAKTLFLSDTMIRISHAMRLHADNKRMLLVGFRAVRALAPSYRNNRRKIGEADVCDIIISSLKTHKEDLCLVELGCGTIGCLAATSNSNEIGLDESMIFEIFLQLISLHNAHSSFMESAISMFINISSLVEIQTIIRNDDKAIPILISCLKFHITSPGVVKMACIAIRIILTINREALTPCIESGCDAIFMTLSANKHVSSVVQAAFGAMEKLVDMGGLTPQNTDVCEDIVFAFKVHRKVDDVAESGASLIRTLFNGDKAFCKKLFDMNISDILVSVLECQSDNATTIESCCWCMRYLMKEPNRSYAENRLLQIGASAAVVAAMSRQFTRRGVAECGCTVISLFAEIETSIPLLVEQGACEAIISAIKCHSVDVGVVEAGCSAIILLMSLESARLRMIEAETDAVLRSFWEDKVLNKIFPDLIRTTFKSVIYAADVAQQIQQVVHVISDPKRVLRVLLNIPLAIDDDKHRHNVLLSSPNVAADIIKILSAHMQSIDICTAAFLAMKTLCRFGFDKNTICRDFAFQLGNCGACSAVVNALTSHSKVACAAEAGCLAIRNLAISKTGNAEKFGVAGACELVTSLLCGHKNDPRVAEAGCWAVRNLAVDNETNQQKLGNSGACEAVLSAILAHSGDACVAEAGCWAVRTLADNPNNERKLRELGAWDAIVSTVQRHLSYAGVAESGCGALVTFAYSGSSADGGMTDFDVCGAVVGSLKMHKEVADVVESSCWAIVNLASNRGKEVKLGQAGACDAVVIALQLHMQKSSVVEAACCAIVNLASNPGNEIKLNVPGVIEVIVLALVTHMTVSAVAESACWAIKNLADIEGNVAKLSEIGACEAVVSALQLHSSVVAIGEAACGAIKNLATKNALNAQKLVDAGASDALVQVIRSHSNVAAVIEGGCAAIQALAENAAAISISLNKSGVYDALLFSMNNRSTAINVLEACLGVVRVLASESSLSSPSSSLHNVCKAVVSLMRSHIDNEAVSEAGCWAISSLAATSESIARKLAEFDSFPLVVTILTKYLSVPVILNAGCRALGHLSITNNFNEIKLVEVDPCAIIIHVLTSYPAIPILSASSCFAAKNISAVSKTLALKLGQDGACAALVTILISHVSSNESITELCCYAIGNLATASKDIAVELGDMDACESVVYALQAYISRHAVAEAGCWAIKSLAIANECNELKLSESGGCDAVLSAIKIHLSIPKVVEYGCLAISNLVAAKIELESKFTMNGAIETLITTLKLHASYPETIEACCWAITRLGHANKENITKFGELDACEDVIKALLTYNTQSSVSEAVCWAIETLSTPGYGNDQKLSLNEVFNGLIDCMKYNNRGLVEAGCLAIKNLAFISITNRQLLADAGAAETVISSLSAHRADAAVIQACCLAIKNLTEGEMVNIVLLLDKCAAREAITDAVVIHIANPNVCEECFWALRNLAIAKTEDIKVFREIDSIGKIVLGLKTHGHIASVAEAGCSAIANLAICYGYKEVPSSVEACQVVVSALTKHASCTGVVEAASMAISNLVLHDSNNTSLGSLKAYEAVLAAMKTHVTVPGIAEAGCMALGNLATMASNSSKLLNCNTHDIVMTAINTHSASCNVIKAGCLTLESLVTNIPEMQERIVDAGASELLVSILKKYMSFVDIVDASFWAIVTLSNTKKYASRIAIAGASDPIIECMAIHRDVSSIAEAGCTALRLFGEHVEREIVREDLEAAKALVLALSTHSAVIEVAREGLSAIRSLSSHQEGSIERFAKTGACSVVIDVLMKNKTDVLVAENGCWAIRNLSKNTENALKLGNEGACEAVIAALEHNSTEALVVETGFQAIINLIEVSPELADRFGDANACRHVLTALKAHLSDPSIAKAGCQTIRILASSTKNQEKLIDSCETILWIMIKYPDDLGIIEAGLWTISSLSITTNDAILVEGCDMCQIIVSSLVNHYNESNIAKGGCWAIGNLIIANEIHAKRLVDAGAFQVVVSILNIYKSKPDITEAGCWALQYLGKSLVNSVEIVLDGVGACQVIIEVLTSYKELQSVTEKACGAIAAIILDSRCQKILFESGVCNLIISAILFHKNSTLVATSGLNALLVFFTTFHDQLSSVESQVCNAVMLVLKININDAAVTAVGFSVIKYLTKNSKLLPKLCEVGACEAIVSGLTAHMALVHIVEAGTSALMGLSTITENQLKINQVEGYTLLISCLLNHSNSAIIAEAIFFSMRNLLQHESFRGITQENTRVLTTIVTVLQCHISHEKVAIAGCWLIENIIQNNIIIRDSTENISACEAILAAVCLHTTSETVAEVGCKALSALMGNNDHGVQSCTVSVCNAVISCINTHLESGEVVTAGCLAIHSTFMCNNSSSSDHNNNLDLKIICEIISLAINTHTTIPNVIDAACLAITSLITFKAELSSVFGGNACALVVGALRSHMINSNVAESTAWALGNLARDDMKNANIMMELGACEQLVQALLTYKAAGRVSEAITSTIGIMAAMSDSISTVLGEAGAAEAVMFALATHLSIGATAKASFITIKSLAAANKCHAIRLVDAGACELLVTALRHHISFSEFVELGYWTINEIAKHDSKFSIKFGEFGACEAVVSSLGGHLKTTGVAIAGCSVIQTLSMSDDSNKIRLNESGACEVVLSVLRTHLAVSEVVDAACRAIINMATGNSVLTYKLTVLGGEEVLRTLFVSPALTAEARQQAREAFQRLIPLQDIAVSLQAVLSSSADEATICRALSCVPLSTGEDRERHRILGTASGVTTSIIQLLKLHPSSIAICMAAFDAIRALCCYGFKVEDICMENIIQLGKAGACEAVLSAIVAHSSVSSILEEGYLATSLLVIYPANAVKMGESGTLDVILTSLASNFISEKIVNFSFQILSRIVDMGSRYKLMISRAGGCETIVTALRCHITIGSIIQLGCTIIYNMANGFDDHKKRFIAGGAEEVLRLIHKSECLSNEVRGKIRTAFQVILSVEDVIMILNQAITDLSNISLAERVLECIPLVIGGDKVRHREMGTTTGVAENIIKLIGHYKSYDSMCYLGFMAVQALCRYGVEKSTLCEENVKELGKAGACEMLVTMIKSPTLTINMLVAGCSSIRNLAVANELNGGRFVTSGACEALISIFNTHKDSPIINELVCGAFANLAASRPQDVKFVETGVCDLVISAMTSYVEVVAVEEAGCGAIANLASNRGNVAVLVAAGACLAVVSAIQHHPGKNGISEAGSWAIANLADSNATRLTLSNAGACEVLASALRCGTNGVTIAGCSAINNLIAGSKEIKKRLIATGVTETLRSLSSNTTLSSEACSISRNLFQRLMSVPLVLASVKNAMNKTADIQQVEFAFESIYAFIDGDKDKQRSLGASPGLIADVVQLLTFNISSIGVCKKGLDTIKSLCWYGNDSTSACDDNIANLGEYGACEAVTSAIRIHIHDQTLVEVGCKTLVNLMIGHADHVQRVKAAGGEEILRSISSQSTLSQILHESLRTAFQLIVSQHDVFIAIQLAYYKPSNKDLVERALENLPLMVIADRDKHRLFGSSDALTSSIVYLFKENITSEVICLKGLAAISALCRYSNEKASICEETVVQLGKAGACNEVVSALLAHLKSPAVAETGCIALKNLVNNGDNGRRLVRAGACEVVIAVLKAHSSMAPVVEAACWALVNLATCNNIEVHLGEVGACEAVISSVLPHVHVVGVAEASCLAMANLGTDKTNALRLLNAGAYVAISEFLAKHKDSSAVVEAGCWALRNLGSATLSNEIKVDEAGVCAIVVGCMDVHRKNARVVEAGCWTIYTFAVASHGNKLTLGEAGACEIIVSAMFNFNQSVEIVLAAIEAVIQLSVVMRNATLICNASGCLAIIEGMKTHHNESSIIQAGCKCIIDTGTIYDDVRKRFIADSAEDVLRLIHKADNLSEDVRTRIRSAFQVLLSVQDVVRILEVAVDDLSDNSLAERVFESIPLVIGGDKVRHREMGTTTGVAENIIKLLGRNIGSEYICHLGFIAVQALCRYGVDNPTVSEENVVELSKAGASRTILAILQTYGDHSDMVEKGFLALMDLVNIPEIKDMKIGEKGLFEAFTALFRTHLGSPKVAEAGCVILRILARRKAATKPKEITKAYNAVIDALGTHMTSHAVVVEAGCRALLTLTSEEECGIPFLQLDDDLFTAIISCIHLQAAVPEVVNVGCRAITNLARRGPDSQDRMLELGACESVVSGLVTHMSLNESVQIIAETIGTLAIYYRNHEVLGEIGACEALVLALNIHKTVITTAETICEAFRNLSYDSFDCAGKLGEADACNEVISVLRMHMSVGSIVETTCWVIRNLALYNGHNVNSLLQIGGYQVLVSALSVHTNRPDVVKAVCNALLDLFKLNKDFMRTIDIPETISILTSICCHANVTDDIYAIASELFQQFFSLDDLIVALKRAILNETDVSYTETLLDKLTLAVVGNNKRQHSFGTFPGVASDLLQLINMHINSQTMCIKLLKVICALGGYYRSSRICCNECIIEMGSRGICEAVLNIVEMHMINNNSIIIELGLIAINNLAQYNDNAILFGERGGCTLLTSILETHRETLILAEAGCWTIQALAACTGNKMSLGKAGACEIITNTVKFHILESSIVLAGCSAIRHLAQDNYVNAVKLGEVGACDAVVCALNQHMASASVAEASCWAIHALTSIKVNKLKLGTSGACDAVIIAMKTHLSAAGTIEASCYAMKSLCNDNFTNAVKLEDAGACDMVIQCLKAHSRISGVVEGASGAICALVSGNDIRKIKMVNGGAGEVLMKAIMDESGLNLEAQKQATEALQRIAPAKEVMMNLTQNVHVSSSSSLPSSRYNNNYNNNNK